MEKTDFQTAVETHQNMVYRIALQQLGAVQEAEDMTQEVFLRLYLHDQAFDTTEHLRRWLIRVTINACRDVLRSPWRRRRVSLDELPPVPVFDKPEQSDLYREVMTLPEKYRTVLYLFYYEGFSVKEMAELLGIRESSVTTRLFRARKHLKEHLTEVWQDE